MPTPEQIAKRMTYDPVFEIGVNVRDMMAAHIAQAIRAERAACLEIVRVYGHGMPEAGVIEHRIRERR